MVKIPPANAGDARLGFHPWVRKTPWSRKWQPAPEFLPRKFHRQRSLADYSLWGHKESDRTEYSGARSVGSPLNHVALCTALGRWAGFQPMFSEKRVTHVTGALRARARVKQSRRGSNRAEDLLCRPWKHSCF